MPYKNIADRRANYKRRIKNDPEFQAKRRMWQAAYRARGGKRAEYERIKSDPQKYSELLAKRTAYRRSKHVDAIRMYGNKCACCGEREYAFLAIDHIHRGGKAQRASVASTPGGAVSWTKFYVWLTKLGKRRKGFRVLCHNCNFATRYGDKCPHRTK